MSSMTILTKMHGGTSLGSLEGITNMTRLTRLTKMTRLLRPPRLGSMNNRIPDRLV